MGKKSRRRNGRPRSTIRNVEINNDLGRRRSTASNEEIDSKNIQQFQMNVAVPHGVDPETYVRQKLAAANIDPNRFGKMEWERVSAEEAAAANKENRSNMSDGVSVDHTPSKTPSETTSTTDAKANSNKRNDFIPRGFDSTGVPIPAGVDPETFFKGKYSHSGIKQVNFDADIPPGVDRETFIKKKLAEARAKNPNVVGMHVQEFKTQTKVFHLKTSLPPGEFIAKMKKKFEAGGFGENIKDIKLEALSGHPDIIKVQMKMETPQPQTIDEETVRAALSAPTQVKPKMTLQDMTSQLQDLGIQADSPHSVDEDRPRQITTDSNVVKVVEIEDSEIEELMKKNVSIKAASSCTDGPRLTKKGVKAAISNDLQHQYLQEIAEKVELGLPGVHAVLIPRAGDGVGRGRPYCVDEVSPWMDYCANCYSGVVAYDDADSFCISTPRFDCANCHKVWYCNSKCQSEHWKWHKKRCKSSTGTKEERKEWKRQARQWEEENAEMLQVEKYKMKYHEEMMKVENKVYVKPKKMS